jgi:hypothetical protein
MRDGRAAFIWLQIQSYLSRHPSTDKGFFLVLSAFVDLSRLIRQRADFALNDLISEAIFFGVVFEKESY